MGLLLWHRECELLSIIKKNPQITQEEASKELGWKLSLVKYYFTSLKKKGRLIRKGTSQNGRWELP